MVKLFFFYLFLVSAVVSFTGAVCPPAYPRFPSEFLFSSNGKPPFKDPGPGGAGANYDCINVNEPSDQVWKNNYFCFLFGRGYRRVIMQWSYKGMFISLIFQKDTI